MTADLWPDPVDPHGLLSAAGIIDTKAAHSVPRAQLAAESVWWDAVAAEAATRSARVREQLDTQARQELARDGVAPTWRIPGLGTVPLSMTADRIDVDDADAFTAWVAARFPEQIETNTRVRPAYEAVVRKAALKRGAACDDQGEVIPGLKFVPGGRAKGIQVRATDDAKASAAAIAGAALDGLFEARTLALQVAPLVLEQLQQEAGA